MLIIISPSKTQDFTRENPLKLFTLPIHINHSKYLLSLLKPLSTEQISSFMKISPKLAAQTRESFQQMNFPFDSNNSKQAMLSFTGEMYNSINGTKFTEDDFSFAQQHLRILSGFYGVLRPLDLIQPYRLEMAASLANQRGKNLYEFWRREITNSLQEELKKHTAKILLNLASNEYFKAIDKKLWKHRILTISFKEKVGDKYKIVGIHAKRARGMFVNYIIINKITDVEDLKKFRLERYRYDDKLSSENEWIFWR